MKGMVYDPISDTMTMQEVPENVPVEASSQPIPTEDRIAALEAAMLAMMEM